MEAFECNATCAHTERRFRFDSVRRNQIQCVHTLAYWFGSITGNGGGDCVCDDEDDDDDDGDDFIESFASRWYWFDEDSGTAAISLCLVNVFCRVIHTHTHTHTCTLYGVFTHTHSPTYQASVARPKKNDKKKKCRKKETFGTIDDDDDYCYYYCSCLHMYLEVDHFCTCPRSAHRRSGNGVR